MAKFKKGDRVQVLEDDSTRIGSPRKGEMGTVDEDNNVNPWVLRDNGTRMGVNENNLELLNKTLRDMQVGDLVQATDGTKLVLERLTQTFLLSKTSNHSRVDDWWTVAEMEERGFTLKAAPAEAKEMTVAEISEKLGYEVKVIK